MAVRVSIIQVDDVDQKLISCIGRRIYNFVSVCDEFFFYYLDDLARLIYENGSGYMVDDKKIHLPVSKVFSKKVLGL